MTTLTEFLLARIAEDEAVAQGVRPHENLSTRDLTDLGFVNRDGYARCTVTSGRVLAECEAKRRIVTAARDYSPELEHGDNGEWALEMALQALALPYAEHEDYREEWRP
ncbi:DUF6221 family protein [Auraticoccus monumenti]|uniref:Uncharacterized protein n=1 Tax=Auraticoccus monumenti TaxID=675864 RepID=A0A1G6UKI1_9ACTN|nr:DUF6221 family protein [Auraticoccus monumenti]SDD41789.1 hypothetical protein SAMN04489747_0907 [Auraticoccus monumenti]